MKIHTIVDNNYEKNDGEIDMNKYQGISLPKKLLDKIDEKIKGHGFTNKTEFIRQAIRHELRRL